MDDPSKIQKKNSDGDGEVRRRFWSELPFDVLSLISSKLNFYFTLMRFRAVCKNWQSSTPPPFIYLHPNLPCKVSFHNVVPQFVTSGGSFLVVSTAIFLLRRRHDTIGKSNPWLVAVEQSSSGKLRLFHSLTSSSIHDVPRFLSNFSAIKLTGGCNIRLCDGITPALVSKNDSFDVNKVLLWPNEINHLSVMVLYGKGSLGCFRLSEGRKREIEVEVDGLIDDMVIWRGMVWAVGRKGRFYGIDYHSLSVNATLAINSDLIGYRRKRLLLDSNGELYLISVRRLHCNEFDIYKLNLQYVWEKVLSLGDRTLFVNFDTCFFVSLHGRIPGFEKNCIVFSKNCFPNYRYTRSNNYDDKPFEKAHGNFRVGVCRYGEGKNFGLISEFPGLSAVLWPPPQWAWNPIAEQETRQDLCSKKAIVEDQEQTVVDASCTGVDVLPPPQTTTEEFQGVDVRSNLVPVLEKVWAKYGNIVEGSALNTCKTKSMACESLAKMVSILQNTSANTLTEHEAQYLKSTLTDLQHVRLKVDWLVPFVEKAFVLCKSKSLVAALLELQKAKVHAEEMQKKVDAEMEKGSELDSRSKLVLQSMLSEVIDLDKCLGEGVC